MRVVSCRLQVHWVLAEMGDYGMGRGFGGVNDGEGVVEGGESSTDCGLKERVVGAAEKEGCCPGGLVEGFC